MSAFDHPDRLNDDGTVTFTMAPSSWHAYNVSPDTYNLVDGESWLENEVTYWQEETGRDLMWDDFDITYDHPAIVRGFAEVLADWLHETLFDAGLESVQPIEVIDTWSPAYYNFQSDGFEVRVTCDPAELRALTPDFDLDEWGREVYSSYDGFRSYVTGRLHDDEWRAQYDAEFRVESLLRARDEYGNRDWILALAEAEYEVYTEHTTVTIKPPEESSTWGEETREMDEYARELTRQQAPGQESIPA